VNIAEQYRTPGSLRQYLLPAMKLTFGDACAICGKHQNSYEIDHLRYSDKATMYDLQLLCSDCHKVKTMDSNDAWLSHTPHCPTCTCYLHTDPENIEDTGEDTNDQDETPNNMDRPAPDDRRPDDENKDNYRGLPPL